MDTPTNMKPVSSALNAAGHNVESSNRTPCARRGLVARYSVVVQRHCKRSPALCTSSSTASGGCRRLEMTMLTKRKRVIL